jgi:hypothetical protein
MLGKYAVMDMCARDIDVCLFFWILELFRRCGIFPHFILIPIFYIVIYWIFNKNWFDWPPR